MEVLIPLAPFIMVVAIIAIIFGMKNRERRDVQKTIRTALEKGQSLPPELIEALSKDSVKVPATAHRDLRVGVIWLAVGLGIAVFAWMVGYEENDAVYPLIGIASIPGFIGLAFIVLSFFNRNKG